MLDQRRHTCQGWLQALTKLSHLMVWSGKATLKVKKKGCAAPPVTQAKGKRMQRKHGFGRIVDVCLDHCNYSVRVRSGDSRNTSPEAKQTNSKVSALVSVALIKSEDVNNYLQHAINQAHGWATRWEAGLSFLNRDFSLWDKVSSSEKRSIVVN